MPSHPRQAVIVLGMHRSGTSALTGLLARLGFALPRTPLADAADNPEGFYESRRILDQNFEILRDEHCVWNICITLDPAELQARTSQETFELLYDILRYEYEGSTSFVLKDPRLCLLLPLWFPGLARLSSSQHALLMLRHPAEVVRSHIARNNLPEEEVLMNLLHHTLEAERMSRNLPRAVVLYDDLMAGWRGALAPALRTARITPPLAMEEAGAGLDRYIVPAMRHHKVVDKTARLGPPHLAPLVDASWRAFTALARDPQDDYALAALDDVRDNFFLIRQNLIAQGLRVVMPASIRK